MQATITMNHGKCGNIVYEHQDVEGFTARIEVNIIIMFPAFSSHRISDNIILYIYRFDYSIEDFPF